eukprot:scaffold1146_cov399-Prasinococcus_capsulatus_cf.AAC.61
MCSGDSGAGAELRAAVLRAGAQQAERGPRRAPRRDGRARAHACARMGLLQPGCDECVATAKVWRGRAVRGTLHPRRRPLQHARSPVRRQDYKNCHAASEPRYRLVCVAPCR